jgi:RNA polymerase sigma factor (sigma-70 family)
VFTILARKANLLGDKTILPGWLCRTARNVAANALTIQRRRQRREQEAYMETILNGGCGASSQPIYEETWAQIAPLLDAALARLGGKDHDAIVLRFFENKELRQVGAALGVSEDAAKKRVSRALEKLRRFFLKRGVDSTASAIGETISANSIQVAPVALAKTVTAVALAKGATASISTLTLIKGALKIMAWTKAKTAVVAGAVLILAAGTTTVIVTHSTQPPAVEQPPGPLVADAMFKAESVRQMNVGKQWGLAFMLYANDHQMQLPKNFDRATIGRYVPGLSETNWEIVSSGSLDSIVAPAETIMLREKPPRQAPDGTFAKAYVFVDGHVELVSSPNKDFSAVEKQRGFLAVPAGN